jgi:TonB-linked SusC/RagA family outer membrane protein
MLHKCLKALLVALLAAAPVAAQDAIIRGTVTSDRGEVVQVASVQIPELNVQTLTGANGQYSILIPAARVRGQTVALRIRSIGHKPSTKSVVLNAGEQTIDFTLATDVNMLDAIIVTGVQEATEAAKVPFGVTRVDAGNLPVAASDPIRQLQGKIGANIVSASGRPGAQPSVLLRGPTMLNAQGRSQDPLYIVDGVVIAGGLPEINPSDIESFEVVKGAAGSSLYGARAGNGVITIKTKSGSRALEGVKFGVRSEYGSSDIERDFGLAHFHSLAVDETGLAFCQNVTGQPFCARSFDYAKEALRINNNPDDFALSPPGFPIDPGSTIGFTAPGYTGNPLKERFNYMPWPGTSYNAVAQTVQPHPYVSNSLDMTGRLGGTRFFASAASFQEQGAIRYLQGFERQSFRANVDQVIGTAWNIGLRTFYSRAESDGLNQEAGGTAFFRLTRVPAVVNILARDSLDRLYIRPNLQGGGSQNENPLSTLFQTDRTDVTYRFVGGMHVTYTPTSWLNFEGQLGYDSRRISFSQINDKGFRTTTSTPATNNGNIFRGAQGDEVVDGAVSGSVRRNLTPDLIARFQARAFFEQRDFEQSTGQGNFLSVKGVSSLGNATQNFNVASTFRRIRQIGQFAGAGFEFKERYILDALVRRDGSSLFGEGKRWATFGRFSAAWRAGEEPWWPLPQFSEFKLRGSYGTAGGSPQFVAQYEAFTIGNGGLLTLNVLGNSQLQPEVNKEVELGLEAEILGKYGITATYARANIERQILPVPVSSSTGYSNQWQNAGALLNITHELSLNLPLVQQRGLTWTMSLVYDHNRSFITQLDVPPFFYGANLQATNQIFRAAVGEQIGTFYGRYFLRNCRELPSAFQSDCGVAGQSSFQFNDEGWLVWVGPNNNPGDGITRNLWETSLPAAQAPWGVTTHWGMPIILRGDASSQQTAQIVKLGNALPDFRFAITQNFQFRKLSVYALVDAAIGQKVWNQGFHWAHLDFLSKDVDQGGKSVQSAKPIGYYYRAPAPDAGGVGGFYDILGANNYSVESASYAKLREVTFAYRIGRIGGIGDWELSVQGRNLVTLTGYRGFDPEVGVGVSGSGGEANSAAINAIDAFTFPNTRSFTVRVSTTF